MSPRTKTTHCIAFRSSQVLKGDSHFLSALHFSFHAIPRLLLSGISNEQPSVVSKILGQSRKAGWTLNLEVGRQVVGHDQQKPWSADLGQWSAPNTRLHKSLHDLTAVIQETLNLLKTHNRDPGARDTLQKNNSGRLSPAQIKAGLCIQLGSAPTQAAWQSSSYE